MICGFQRQQRAMMNQPPDDHSDDSAVRCVSGSSVMDGAGWLARFPAARRLSRAVFRHAVAFQLRSGNGFLDCDDPDYVTKNAHVQAGLTWAGVRWAFTSGDAANWFPLTWLRDESWLPAWDWPAVQQTVSLAKAGAVVGHNFLLKQRGRLTFLSETMGMLFACLRAIK